jgi:hypothetical protein
MSEFSAAQYAAAPEKYVSATLWIAVTLTFAIF